MSGGTILRQWALFKAIPRQRKATAQELAQMRAREGFDDTEHAVQRDLIKLSSIFPIEADERSKPSAGATPVTRTPSTFRPWTCTRR